MGMLHLDKGYIKMHRGQDTCVGQEANEQQRREETNNRSMIGVLRNTEVNAKKTDRIFQIRYARLNCPLWCEDRTNGETTDTGGEARRRLVGQVNDKNEGNFDHLGSEGEKSLRASRNRKNRGQCRRTFRVPIDHNKSVCAG